MKDAPLTGLSVAAARERLLKLAAPVAGVETLPLRAALDRILAVDVISPIDVPAHDNSAMDGYALHGADLPAAGSVKLAIVGSAFAGAAFGGTVGRGQCVRIMTGAVMPAGCDTVLPQEFAAAADEHAVEIAAGAVRAGDHRRLRGEDLTQGKPALVAGRRLRPADLGLTASLGIAELSVRRRPRVAFFSTGDELCSLGEPLREGCVYDSNRYTVYGMLTRLGCEPLDLGVVRDAPEALRAALEAACAQGADAIITTGGVSVGEADFVREVMDSLGKVDFWKLLIRPGRPLAFGRIDAGGRSALLFGLPGNPVAAMVTFYFFARLALLRMMGQTEAPELLVAAHSATAIRKKPGRTEYQRGILAVGADGRAQVSLTGAQGAGVLRSMSEANCIVVLGDAQGNVAAGEEVAVLPFDGLV